MPKTILLPLLASGEFRSGQDLADALGVSRTAVWKQLNKLSVETGLEIESVKPQREEASQYYARIPVHLKLKGSYYQLAKFFYLVGNLDRVINIENINLKIANYEESSAILNADVLATTFRSIQKDQPKI